MGRPKSDQGSDDFSLILRKLQKFPDFFLIKLFPDFSFISLVSSWLATLTFMSHEILIFKRFFYTFLTLSQRVTRLVGHNMT